MIPSIQTTVKQISSLSEDKQDILATYLQKHLEEILQKAEKEKRIEEKTYTISDFNEETQEVINKIEQQQNLTVCRNKDDLYNQLGI